MTLYHVPSSVCGSKLATSGAGGAGAASLVSAPPSRMAILMQPSRSTEHSSRSLISALPYLAKQPVMQALSPRHLAVHVMPLRQSLDSRQLFAGSAHRVAKHSVSMSDESKPLAPSAASSFSPKDAAGSSSATDASAGPTAPRIHWANGGPAGSGRAGRCRAPNSVVGVVRANTSVGNSAIRPRGAMLAAAVPPIHRLVDAA
mmetsp:Transcript_15151/g.52731  ORF Transcript_15151/g.52731 Transcript_15151/m.52731 type:complete len:202 (-) Transcript_15151:16-621(-)